MVLYQLVETISADPAIANVRTRILTEATHLFAVQGYDGSSIEEIARAAGITRPTLVYHFGSKAELRDQVLATLLGHWRDELPRVLSAATTGSDRFRSAFDAVASFFRSDAARGRLLIRELLDRPEAMAELFRVHLQPWTQLIADYIRRGQEEGRIRPSVDPEAYLLQVLNAVIATAALAGGGAGTAHILPNPPDLDRQLAELHRMARSSLFNDRPA
ncbi:MAG: TetR/AcrR family transcriptional regulator [Myxococcota bacterium]